MKKNNKQALKLIGMIFSVLILTIFLDFIFGQFMIGFNNPK